MTSMPSIRQQLTQRLLWTAFFNGVIAAAISIQGILIGGLPDSMLSITYLLLQQFGHFQFLSFVVVLPLLLISFLLPWRRLLLTLTLMVFSAYILLVFIDYAVFKLYRFHLNGMVWNLLTGGAMEEIFVFDRDNIISATLFIGIILFTQAVLQFIISRRAQIRAWPKGGSVFLLVLLVQVCGQMLYAWSDAWQRSDILSQARYIPFPQGITIKRFLREKGWAPDLPEPQQLASTAHGAFHYPLQPLQCNPVQKRPNILFIISDGLRFDMLNPDVMPAWSALAQQSQVFEHHVSTGNATRFGVYGLFSGLYGHYWFDSLNNQSGSVLIDQLKQLDYRFGFFANARLSSPEFDKAIFPAVRESIPDKTPGKDVIAREYEINRQARAFFQQASNDPFFAFVFYDAPHAYVYPPEDAHFLPALESLNYLALDNDSDPDLFLNRYKNSIAFTDRLSSELFDTLRAQGQMDNTIIIMTGDHGQEANETRTNSWGHNSNFSRYQIQVPLLIYWPGREPQRFTHLTSHVDVLPTLMQEILGCQNPASDYSNGRSLFDQGERDFVLVKNWNNQGMVGKDRIVVFPKIGPAESYDFKNYQPLPADSAGTSINPGVIEQISRFYR